MRIFRAVRLNEMAGYEMASNCDRMAHWVKNHFSIPSKYSRSERVVFFPGLHGQWRRIGYIWHELIEGAYY